MFASSIEHKETLYVKTLCYNLVLTVIPDYRRFYRVAMVHKQKSPRSTKVYVSEHKVATTYNTSNFQIILMRH